MTTANRPVHGLAASDDSTYALFSTMLRLRRFEEKAGMLYAQGTLGTPCPLGIGREGAIAAIAESLHPGDIFMALGNAPAYDLALGTSLSKAFQNLMPAQSEPKTPPDVLLRLPAEAHKKMSLANACSLLADRSEMLILVASTLGDLANARAGLSNRLLPIIVTPSDQKPESWSDLAPWSVRECDGTDADSLCDTLASVRENLASGHGVTALAVLTPPYVGHACGRSARQAMRRETHDPIALCRQRLLRSGSVDEATVAALEASIRDEVAAVGRAVSLACT